MKIFLAAQPKSGSTHIQESLMRYFGAYRAMANTYQNYGIEAQDIVPQILLTQLGRDENLVFKHHAMGTPNTVNHLKFYNVPVLVVTRDVADAIVSLREYMISSPWGAQLFPMPIGLPMWDNWKKKTKVRQFDHLIHVFAPWMICFQLSWARNSEGHYTLAYEDFMNDEYFEFKKFLRWLGEEVDEIKAAEAIDMDDPRVNTKRPGRGREELTEEQYDRILRMERDLR